MDAEVECGNGVVGVVGNLDQRKVVITWRVGYFLLDLVFSLHDLSFRRRRVKTCVKNLCDKDGQMCSAVYQHDTTSEQ